MTEPENKPKSDNPGLDSGETPPNFSEETPQECNPEEDLGIIALDSFQKNSAAFHEIAEAIQNAINAIVEKLIEALRPLIKQLVEAFADFYDRLLHSVATRDEWRRYKHSKKWRIRKKYRKRLERRLAAVLEGGEPDR